MIDVVPETGSTNADLAARLAGGEFTAEGNWLVADRQTAGKGRQGRTWCDGSGNFMGSTVVYPCAGDPPAVSLALLAGLALHEVIAPLIPPPGQALLKWPNDVMVGSAKLAGILLERVGQAVIVGIGVNLARAPEVKDRETISLSDFGPAPDRDHFAQALSRQFGLDLERWRNFGLEPVINRWLAAAHPLGTMLVVGEAGRVPDQGQFAGLSSDGALKLKSADGTVHTIHAGEVRLAGGQ